MSVDGFDKYDLIFIGYPIWYGRMATPMQAFLHEHASKLEGKRVALFATSGSSGISTSANEAPGVLPASNFYRDFVADVKRACPDVRAWGWQRGSKVLGANREDEEDGGEVRLKVKDDGWGTDG